MSDGVVAHYKKCGTAAFRWVFVLFEQRKLISFGGEGQWDLEGSWCFGACLGADLRASL